MKLKNILLAEYAYGGISRTHNDVRAIKNAWVPVYGRHHNARVRDQSRAFLKSPVLTSVAKQLIPINPRLDAFLAPLRQSNDILPIVLTALNRWYFFEILLR